MAGAEFYEQAYGRITFRRNLFEVSSEGKDTVLQTYSFDMPVGGTDFRRLAEAEQKGRDLTYSDNLVRGAESLSFVSPTPLRCKKTSADFSGIEAGHFIPYGFDNLYVLGDCADIPRQIAGDFCSAGGGLALAAELIGRLAATTEPKVGKAISPLAISGEELRGYSVAENLQGIRPYLFGGDARMMRAPESYIPVVDSFDVVVAGGGTSGAPAAIAAAGQGMKTLVVEYLEGLGGIGTLGLIGKAYHGQRRGFAASVPFPENNIELKMEWYRRQIRSRGGEIWLGAVCNGVLMKENKLCGLIVLTPQGCKAVLAKVVIDATGNGDVAIDAGASFMFADLEKGDLALQGSGYPPRPLAGSYYNTDYLLVDETDMIDAKTIFAGAHKVRLSEGLFDAGVLIDNREKRRIIADHILAYVDQIAERTYPDAIVYSGSDYDSHGYPSSLYFAMMPHDSVSLRKNHPAPGGYCYTPYRSLLPRGIDGILVTGTAIGMERDATAMVRMQFDLANQGYAAGLAAAMAVQSGVSPRDINIRQLQRELIAIGNLPEDVLQHTDSYPLPAAMVEQAVIGFGQALNPTMAAKPLAIIVSHLSTAIPLLKKHYSSSDGRAKLLYAQILGMNGHSDGRETLMQELERNREWDKKVFQGYMADYAHLPTPRDALILALGFSGGKESLAVILREMETLTAEVTLSHFRSIALALEQLRSPDAVQPLIRLLNKEGIQGHAIHSIDSFRLSMENNGVGKMQRTNSLREIMLARALLISGDSSELAIKILESYKKDLRAVFAQHAARILENR
jgi:hypothetical protein